MKHWNLFFVLLSFAFLSGCGGDDDGKIITLESDDVESVSSATPDECDDDYTASSSSDVSSSSDASSSSVSSSSKVSSSSYGGIGKSKIIHGFAQKGTPVDQAEVRVVFLDESTLDRVGKAYMGKFEGDFGEYSVQVDSVESKIVQISVAGETTMDKYSEVRAVLATNDIIMNAVVDIGLQDSISVNLFTHLETERVRELVRNKHLSFDEAKRQSRKEILELFHVKFLDESGNEREARPPETWSFFGNTIDDIFLMAGSILLSWVSGSLSDPLFESLLEDFAMEGKWNNDSAMYRIAKSAFTNNLSRMSGDVIYPVGKRGTDIELWRSKFDSTSSAFVSPSIVSDIDAVFTVFWEKEFGLGSCNQENLNELKKTRYDEVYKCKSPDSHCYTGYCNSTTRWMDATRMESDTYGIECSGTDFFISSENPDSIPYVCESGKWRQTLDIEREIGLCTSDLNGEFRETDKFGYTCKSKSWNIFTDSLVDARDGKIYAYIRASRLYWMIDNLHDTTFTWAEMDECPEGWRLPTKVEWDSLFRQLGGLRDNARTMKLDPFLMAWQYWSSTEVNDSLAYVSSVSFHAMDPQQAQFFSYGTMEFSKNSPAYIRCVKE